MRRKQEKEAAQIAFYQHGARLLVAGVVYFPPTDTSGSVNMGCGLPFPNHAPSAVPPLGANASLAMRSVLANTHGGTFVRSQRFRITSRQLYRSLHDDASGKCYAAVMPTEQIVALLITERNRLDVAIQGLQGFVRRRGRAAVNIVSAISAAIPRLAQAQSSCMSLAVAGWQPFRSHIVVRNHGHTPQTTPDRLRGFHCEILSRVDLRH
jgi:hypothetical protein